jgi:hypothetical protein
MVIKLLFNPADFRFRLFRKTEPQVGTDYGPAISHHKIGKHKKDITDAI